MSESQGVVIDLQHAPRPAKRLPVEVGGELECRLAGEWVRLPVLAADGGGALLRGPAGQFRVEWGDPGLRLPEAPKPSRRPVVVDAEWLDAWLREEATTREASARTGKAEMLQTVNAARAEGGLEALSPVVFGRLLKRLRPEVTDGPVILPGESERREAWKGIALTRPLPAIPAPEAVVLMSEAQARACVARIRQGCAGVVDLLNELRDRDGWKALGYDTWGACLDGEFAESRATLYRALQAAKIAAESQFATGDPLPASSLRALSKAAPEERAGAYEEAQAAAAAEGRARATAADVEEAVEKRLPVVWQAWTNAVGEVSCRGCRGTIALLEQGGIHRPSGSPVCAACYALALADGLTLKQLQARATALQRTRPALTVVDGGEVPEPERQQQDPAHAEIDRRLAEEQARREGLPLAMQWQRVWMEKSRPCVACHRTPAAGYWAARWQPGGKDDLICPDCTRIATAGNGMTLEELRSWPAVRRAASPGPEIGPVASGSLLPTPVPPAPAGADWAPPIASGATVGEPPVAWFGEARGALQALLPCLQAHDLTIAQGFNLLRRFLECAAENGYAPGRFLEMIRRGEWVDGRAVAEEQSEGMMSE